MQYSEQEEVKEVQYSEQEEEKEVQYSEQEEKEVQYSLNRRRSLPVTGGAVSL